MQYAKLLVWLTCITCVRNLCGIIKKDTPNMLFEAASTDGHIGIWKSHDFFFVNRIGWMKNAAPDLGKEWSRSVSS